MTQLKIYFLIFSLGTLLFFSCSDDITNDCKICGTWYTEENANDLRNGYYEDSKYLGTTEGKNIKFEFENNNHFQLITKCKIYLFNKNNEYLDDCSVDITFSGEYLFKENIITYKTTKKSRHIYDCIKTNHDSTDEEILTYEKTIIYNLDNDILKTNCILLDNISQIRDLCCKLDKQYNFKKLKEDTTNEK